MEKIHLRKKIIRCGLIVASQLVIICGASALKTEKADAANKNLAISIANDYVNIRNKPSLQGKIKGSTLQGSAVTITKTYKNGWALIKSWKLQRIHKKRISCNRGRGTETCKEIRGAVYYR